MLQTPALAALLAAASALIILILYLALRRQSAAERERRRRLKVNAIGRIATGTVVDVSQGESAKDRPAEQLIHYTYSIRGVEYSASQDISSLLDRLGIDPSRIPGAVSVKYDSRNPSDSIVICEKWSGLRRTSLTEDAPG